MSSFGVLSLILLLMAAVGHVKGNVLEIRPTLFIPGITSEMTLTCIVSPLSVAVSQVYVLQLEKREGSHDAALATVPSGKPPMIVASSLAGRAKIEGELDQSNLRRAFLKLTITDPQDTDDGQYICTISAMDKTGVTHTLNFWANSSAENIANATHQTTTNIISSELKQLQKQVSELKANSSSLQSVVGILDKECHTTSQLLGVLENRQNATERELKRIRYDIDQSNLSCPLDCTDRIDQLGSKLNWTVDHVENNTDVNTALDAALKHMKEQRRQVMFSARCKTRANGLATLPLPGVIRFDEVLLNEGNGYDAAQGRFTAPVNGTYVIFLNVPIRDQDSKRILHVALLDKATTISQIEKGPGKPLTSISVVYNMQAGDVVYAFVHQITGTSTAPDPEISVYAAYFAGFLIN